MGAQKNLDPAERTTTHTRVYLSCLEANPHRNLATYPLSEAKIEFLRRSIRETGFWDNLLVRPKPYSPGVYEIAYGHHRVEAALRELGADTEIGVNIRVLDDMQMLRIMVDENMDDFASPAAGDHVAVAALVRLMENIASQAEGTPVACAVAGVRAFKIGYMTYHPEPAARYPGGFRVGSAVPNDLLPLTEASQSAGFLYTTSTVSGVFGWNALRAHKAIWSLALVEKGCITATVLANLPSRYAAGYIKRSISIAKAARVREVDTENIWADLRLFTQGFLQAAGTAYRRSVERCLHAGLLSMAHSPRALRTRNLWLSELERARGVYMATTKHALTLAVQRKDKIEPELREKLYIELSHMIAELDNVAEQLRPDTLSANPETP